MRAFYSSMPRFPAAGTRRIPKRLCLVLCLGEPAFKFVVRRGGFSHGHGESVDARGKVGLVCELREPAPSIRRVRFVLAVLERGRIEIERHHHEARHRSREPDVGFKAVDELPATVQPRALQRPAASAAKASDCLAVAGAVGDRLRTRVRRSRERAVDMSASLLTPAGILNQTSALTRPPAIQSDELTLYLRPSASGYRLEDWQGL